MADVIELDRRGRAKCRGCGGPLVKGELRFGEAVANPFAEGETLRWFHLRCGSCMRPQAFLPALDAHAGEVPEREWLRAAAVTGAAHRRLPRLARLERASSGRARCRQCRQSIEKGALRFGLQMFEEDMRPSPIGFLHPACSKPYFGTPDVLERVARLTPDAPRADLQELSELLAQSAAHPSEQPALALAKTRPSEDPEVKAS